jgi:putative chitinase
MQEYKVAINANRMSMFLAQIAHESNGLTHLEENLNYSAGRLAQVWKKFAVNPDADPHERVPNQIAMRYDHRPEKLANFIYANRNGNGDEASGDGWRYRGRGPLQHTGKGNYQLVKDRTGIDCVEFPELLEIPIYGARAAAAHWAVMGLNALADANNFDAITLKINGGMNGSEDRHNRWSRVVEAMNV